MGQGRSVRTPLVLYVCLAIVCGTPLCPPGLYNVALKGQARQSSTKSRQTGAENGVDRKSNYTLASDSVVQTQLEMTPWWEVILSNLSSVSAITVMGRTDCCWARMRNFEVVVYENNNCSAERRILYSSTKPFRVLELRFASPIRARSVGIRFQDTDTKRYLSFGELIVCGNESPITTNSSHFCNEPCPKRCRNDGSCDRSNGSLICKCSDKWTGDECEVPTLRCSNSSCLNGGQCFEREDGNSAKTLFCECLPGWTGKTCETEVACESKPCQNGGVCQNRERDFVCTCNATFSGKLCEVSLCAEKMADLVEECPASIVREETFATWNTSILANEPSACFFNCSFDVNIRVSSNRSFPIRRSLKYDLRISVNTLNRSCGNLNISYQLTAFHRPSDLPCGNLSSLVKVNVNFSANGTSMSVEKRSLEYGKYCFYYTATSQTILSCRRGYIEVSVVPSRLRARFQVSSHSFVNNTVVAGEKLTLNGTASTDPDLDDGHVGLNFSWSCRSVLLNRTEIENCDDKAKNVVAVKGHGCFPDGQTGSVLSVNGTNMEPNRGYIFSLTVSKEERRSGFIKKKMCTAWHPPPLPEIRCTSCDKFGPKIFVPNLSAKLLAICKASEKECHQLVYTWRVFGLGRDGRETELDVNSIVPDNFTIGLYFVIRAGVVQHDVDYVVEVIAEWRFGGHPVRERSLFQVKRPPYHGSCNILPLTGRTLSTNFTFSCQGWKGTTNLTYQLLVGEELTTPLNSRRIVYVGSEANWTLSTLPSGRADSNFTLYAWAEVLDFFGGETVVLIQPSVQVFPVGNDSNARKLAMEFVSDRLDEAASNPDVKEGFNEIISLCDSLLLVGNNDAGKREDSDNLVAKCSSVAATRVRTVEDGIRAGAVVSSATRNSAVFADDSKLKEVSVSLDKWVAIMENSAVHSVHAEKAASVIAEIGSNLIAASFINSNDTRQVMTDVLSTVDRALASAADSLVVGEAPVVISTANLYAKAAVMDIVDNGLPADVTSKEGAGFDVQKNVFDDILVNRSLHENSSFLYGAFVSTFTLLAENPFGFNQSAVSSALYGLNLRQAGEKETLVVNRLPEVNEITITLPRSQKTALPNVTTLQVEAGKFAFVFVNLTEQTDGETVTVDFLSVVFGENGTETANAVDVYFMQGDKPSSADDVKVGKNASLVLTPLGLEVNASKLFLTQTCVKNCSVTTVMKKTCIFCSEINTTQDHYIAFLSRDEEQGFNVSFQSFVSSCLFWNETELRYTNEGCQPTAESTVDVTVCRCNHLSLFGSRMFPTPNPIDFSLFLKLDIASNPVALATILVVFVLYVAAALLARHYDLKDMKYAHELPLCGPDGPYKYNVIVHTATSFNSGTTANVEITLFDESGTSVQRVLKRDGGFRRSSIDRFLIGTNRRLNDILKIQIGHDNTGKSPSWNLGRVIIEDQDSGQKLQFIHDEWISLDSDTGLLIVEIPAATKEELKAFSTVFAAQRRRGFTDQHLWMSLVEKPVYSRFTRVQRVTACLSVLMSFMVVSAMWFGIAPERKPDLQLGFVELSYEQIGIGFMSIVITFPPNFLWLLFFRKAKVKGETAHKASKKGIRHFRLPHFFIYVAYVGCYATALFAVVLILIYGQEFGRKKAERWVTTMILSLLESVFLTEPLKVLVIALFLALVIKPVDTTQDEVVVDPDVRKQDTAEIIVTRMTDEQREKARVQLEKRKHMKATLLEIGTYCLFLFIVVTIAFSDHDDRAYSMTKMAEKIFNVEQFSEIKQTKGLFEWADQYLVNALFWEKWYNGEPLETNNLGFIRGDIGKRLAGAQIRQLRVKPGRCERPNYGPCYPDHSNWETKDFGLGWSEPVNGTPAVLRWNNSNNLLGDSFWGQSNFFYPASGYANLLGETQEEARRVLATLRENLWIDRKTRAVFFEFILYNANVNLFQTGVLMVEYLPSGGLFPQWTFTTVRLIRYVTPFDYFKLFVEVLFGLFTISMTYKLYKNARNQGWSFFGLFWTWVEIIVLILSYSTTAFNIYRTVNINRLMSKVRQRQQLNGFFTTVSTNVIMQIVLAFLTFLAIVKVLKLLRFNRRMTMLGAVLKRTVEEVLSFMFILVLLILSFGMLGNLTLSQSSQFRTVWTAFTTMMRTSLGDSDLSSWQEAGRIMATVIFVAFTLLITFIVLNLFVSILNLGYEGACEVLEKESNDFEVVDYILRSIKLTLGFRQKVSEGAVFSTVKDAESTERPEKGKYKEGDVQANIDKLLHKVDLLVTLVERLGSEKKR